jgi:hypothetical protein
MLEPMRNSKIFKSNPPSPTNNRSNVTIHELYRSNIISETRSNPDCYRHVMRSILAGGVGRVRSQFLEFGDDYLHKPAPTDPIKYDRSNLHPHIRLYGFVGAGLCHRFRIILKSQSNPPSPTNNRSNVRFDRGNRSNRTLSSTHDRITIDIGWWGWAGSFTISGIWR